MSTRYPPLTSQGWRSIPPGSPAWGAVELEQFHRFCVGQALGASYPITSLNDLPKVNRPWSRLKGLYLAIATLAAQMILNFVMIHWSSLTQGTSGLIVDSPELFGFVFDTDESYYFIVLVAVIMATTCGPFGPMGRLNEQVAPEAWRASLEEALPLAIVCGQW